MDKPPTPVPSENVPLIKQVRLIGVLYLENNQTSQVFMPARLAVLKLLATQAAISLENARLNAELIAENGERRRAVNRNLKAQTMATPANSTVDSTATSIVFGPFRLFPMQRLLTEAGTPIHLGSRALDVPAVRTTQGTA